MSEPWKNWGRNPKSPADFPEETAEEAAARARSSMELMVAERGGTGDQAALEREIQRTSAMAGSALPTAAPESAPWTQFSEAGPEETSAPWTQFSEVETPLMSLRGAGTLLRAIGPRISRGSLGMQRRDLEGIQASRLAGGAQIGPDAGDDLTPKIEEKRRAIAEADAELERISGNPSDPLKIAQDVVRTVAANAP